MTAPATLTLYSIENDLLACLDTVEGMEEDDAQRAELEEHIARLVSAELRKVDGVSRMLAHFESQSDLAALEIKRLQTRKKQMEAHTGRLEACVRLAMEASGKTELKGETSTLLLRKNPAGVYVRDFDAVPSTYKIVKTETSIDKIAVGRALKAGETVPGAELVQGDRLVRK